MGRDARGRWTPLAANKLKANTAVDTQARDVISRLAGMQFINERDIDTNLGYTKEPTLEQYQTYYDRRDLASVIVDAPAKTTWRESPTLADGSEGKSKFITGWEEIVRRLKVFSYLERVDRLSGIGHYGVLLIGTKDGQLSEPLEKVASAQDVIYLSTFSEVYATVNTYDTDVNSPRFGRPETYRIDMSSNVVKGFSASQQIVHWTRVIHVAEGLLENEVFGEPRLQKVFNRLEDLDKVVGSSAEAFWQTVVKGYVMSAKEGYELEPGDLADAKTELQNYIHNLQRFIAANGIDFKELGAKPEDPSAVFKILIQIISGKTGIPQRILLGSERGNLASSQDEANWLGRIEGRQVQFAQPNILEALVDRLLSIGALDAPKDGKYKVEWPNLFTLTDEEQANVYQKTADAISKITAGQPLDMFDESELREAMGFPPEREGTLVTNVLDEENPEAVMMFAELKNANNW